MIVLILLLILLVFEEWVMADRIHTLHEFQSAAMMLSLPYSLMIVVERFQWQLQKVSIHLLPVYSSCITWDKIHRWVSKRICPYHKGNYWLTIILKYYFHPFTISMILKEFHNNVTNSLINNLITRNSVVRHCNKLLLWVAYLNIGWSETTCFEV